MARLTCFLALMAFLAPVQLARAVDVVEAYWTFDEYGNGSTIPDGGIVMDISGKDRHLVNRRANTVSNASSPTGTSAIQMSGIDGGTGPRGATDFLEFIPGFSGFTNSGLAAANDPFVFPAGLHWMIEYIATDHDTTNFGEATMISTGDRDDLGGIDRVAADVAPSQIDFVHHDSNDPGQADLEAPFVRLTGLSPPYYHHIALVRDRQNDRLQIYRDSVLEVDVGGVGGGNNVENTSGNLYVGAQLIANIEQATNARLFRGEIDAIRITTRDTFGAGSQFGPDDFLVIPEPSTAMLLALGVFTLIGRRRRQ